MSLRQVLTGAGVAILLANAALLLLVAVHHVAAALRARRRARVQEVLRPHLVRLATEEDAELPIVPRRRGTLLELLALDMLRKVRGEAREALVELLRDRGSARDAARRLGRPGALGRAAAAELLGAVGSRDDVALLRDRLHDRNAEVRAAAARSLGHLGDDGAVRPLVGALDGPRTVPYGTVTVGLLRAGPATVPSLREILTGWPTVAGRTMAAEVLGLHGAVEATGELVDRLGDPSEAVEVQAAAAGALGRIGSPRAVEPLGAALDPGTGQRVRVAAARALGAVGGARAAGLLGPLLADPAHEVASAAARALPGCGSAGIDVLRAHVVGGGAAGAHAREALALAELRADRSRAV